MGKEETLKDRVAREVKESAERERKYNLGKVDQSDASILGMIKDLRARNIILNDQMIKSKEDWRINEQAIQKLMYHLHGGTDPYPYLKIAGIDYKE